MIVAKVDDISLSKDVSCVRFCVDGSVYLTMLSLENLNLKVGDIVSLGFKSSDVIISTHILKNCSLKNSIPCDIVDINFGEILTCITLKYKSYEFESIITTTSAKSLNLKQNIGVFAYIKSTSLFIAEMR